jgi:hypothetical protein
MAAVLWHTASPLFVSRFHQNTVLAPEKYSVLTGQKIEEIANSGDSEVELIPKPSPS